MDSTPPNYCEEINESTALEASIWEGKKEGKGLGEKMKIITRRWTEDDSGLLYVFAPMQEGRGKGGKKKEFPTYDPHRLPSIFLLFLKYFLKQ